MFGDVKRMNSMWGKHGVNHKARVMVYVPSMVFVLSAESGQLLLAFYKIDVSNKNSSSECFGVKYKRCKARNYHLGHFALYNIIGLNKRIAPPAHVIIIKCNIMQPWFV